MNYGKFVYRVVYKQPNEFIIMQLFELDNELYFISKLPSSPLGHSFEQLKTHMGKFNDALNLPIVDYTTVK
jgi:hypothetical protein